MFLTWTRKEQERKEKERKEKKETGKSVQGAQEEEELLPPAMLAAWSAAHFCRALGGRAYARHGRSMLASHLLLHLPEVLHEWFPLDGVKITPKL
jgi:NAD(P)H-hydrate repair Nnr-like enzyme with NAD(P)H-hydrate dehydratase domain